MVQSEYFGRTFWFGKDNQLKSAPTFVDNSVDISMTDYVSDWTDWEGVNMSLLFQIHRTCLHLKQDHANSVSLIGV